MPRCGTSLACPAALQLSLGDGLASDPSAGQHLERHAAQLLRTQGEALVFEIHDVTGEWTPNCVSQRMPLWAGVGTDQRAVVCMWCTFDVRCTGWGVDGNGLTPGAGNYTVLAGSTVLTGGAFRRVEKRPFAFGLPHAAQGGRGNVAYTARLDIPAGSPSSDFTLPLTATSSFNFNGGSLSTSASATVSYVCDGTPSPTASPTSTVTASPSPQPSPVPVTNVLFDAKTDYVSFTKTAALKCVG
jgi:hypothetical protein